MDEVQDTEVSDTDLPGIGETVLFYTHEQMDTTHRTIDRVGIVLAVSPDYVDLKVFEIGKAPYDERAYTYRGAEYDARGNPIIGKSYWRELGSDAPDFEADYAPDEAEVEDPYDREIRLLEERQQAELAAGGVDQKVLEAKWAIERKNIDERYGRVDGVLRKDAQSDNPPQSGQPTKSLLGASSPRPRVPPTVGNKSLPNVL